MRVSVQGEVFFARSAQNVFLLQLEGDAITVNTPSLLAFDAHLGYDIRMLAMPGSLPAGCSTSSFRGRAWWPCPPTVRRCFWTAPSSRPSLTRRRRSAGRRTCSRKSRAPSRWVPSLGAARVSPSSWPSTARASWWSSPARASRWWRHPELIIADTALVKKMHIHCSTADKSLRWHSITTSAATTDC